MGFTEFFIQNKFVLLFYGAIILLLIINRKKFDIQGKIVALYRTKIGLKLMDRISSKYREPIKLLALIGIGIGFIGLITIFILLVHNIWKLIMNPAAPSGVSLVIPGVHIPGAIITPPLIIGWIALFLVIVVHEFSHGVVARAHNIKIKSSGLAFFGPLMGAFVEPDEKNLVKKGDIAEYSVYAAGPFSNILLGLVALLIGGFIVLPIIGVITAPAGFSIASVQEGFPAEMSGLPAGAVIVGMDGVEVVDYQGFSKALDSVKINQTVMLNTDKGDYTVVTVQNPNDETVTKGYIGVSGFKNELELNNDTIIMKIILSILVWFKELFAWVYILSLGIGLANLLPLGPVDGGRMLLTSTSKIFGEKKGRVIWTKLSIFTLLILLLNIFWPLFQWMGTLLAGLIALI